MFHIKRGVIQNEYILHDEYFELSINGSKHGAFTVLLDRDDFEKCNNIRWHIRKFHRGKSDFYYVGANINNKTILMHRYIMNVTKRCDVVDHINGDGLDNRKENLRKCSNAQNTKNRKSNTNNRSGYKGIIWYHYCNINKWNAYIMVDYKHINLGYYDKLEDAIKAREDAEAKYFGDFIREKPNK